MDEKKKHQELAFDVVICNQPEYLIEANKMYTSVYRIYSSNLVM